jgi:L-lactate dehydrogenase complex protein LldF
VTFSRRAGEALQDLPLRGALRDVTDRISVTRTAALDRLGDPDAWRDHARRIRAHTLSRLDHYLDRFVTAVEARGGHVYFAASAEQAARYVCDLARARGLKRAVKSKSMVSEEIDLNRHLEQAGVDVVETDLGEWVVQLGHDHPSHIVMPIIHRTKPQVADLFRKTAGATDADVADVASMTQFARRTLRPAFLEADLGISGVNFGVADTGGLCICTNEGNGRLTTTMPRVHVAMMGMERIVPTVADLGVMLQMLARSATGQNLTVYTNIIHGPRPRDGERAESDGPDELHVVLVDNGRSKVLASEVAEILYCIRCGACLNVCPVYQQIGGHAYGSVYPGPLGAVLTPALWGQDRHAELPHASTLCGACRDVCPVRIDIPKLLLRLRAAGAREGRGPAWVRHGLRLYRRIARYPRAFEFAGRVAAGLSALAARDGWIGRLPGPLAGWTKSRDFPSIPRKSFQDRWKARRTVDGGPS